jgi:hypothetical protein
MLNRERNWVRGRCGNPLEGGRGEDNKVWGPEALPTKGKNDIMAFLTFHH